MINDHDRVSGEMLRDFPSLRLTPEEFARCAASAKKYADDMHELTGDPPPLALWRKAALWVLHKLEDLVLP